ncbi:hypothetical protein [Sphingomonas sp. BK580]|uniref:hypothetical protein n=1 Tax=Sphingomonas sp. BK580 TaxID=2586972 RepID=UPI00161C66A8|nr:hypothetical protein [Sphingomonas sp. BK580]MBB3692009.1 hypothetical protein [Sphingomonas sp. BK580]
MSSAAGAAVRLRQQAAIQPHAVASLAEPRCGRATSLYGKLMRRRLKHLAFRIGLPVLAGQYLFDWMNSGFTFALDHFPVRAILLLSLLLLRAAYQEHRARKKQSFR